MSALEESIAEKVRTSGTSFYAAMRLLPEARRNALFAIYAFCREVDDIADDDAPALDKRRRLMDWREEIDRLYRGHPTTPVAQALLGPVREFGLRREDFLAIIDGMEMDAAADITAPDLATLDLYCDRVASAVGRLSVRAFGAEEPARDEVAYHLGRALQLTNILRDIAEDAARGRLYLPRDLLTKHGIAPSGIDAVLKHPRLPDACRDLAGIARGHFTEAESAMQKCRHAPMRPARVMGAVYRALLDRLEEWDWRDLTTRIAVPKWRQMLLAVRHGFF